MKRLLPALAIIGTVSIASANFSSSNPSDQASQARAVSSLVASDVSTGISPIVAQAQSSDASLSDSFGSEGQAYAFGLVGALSLLAIIVTRRTGAHTDA